MRRPLLKYTASMALACAVAATPLFAQANSGASTVAGADQNWNVTWTGFTTGAGPAFVVTNPPSPWPVTTPNSYWISSNPTASLQPNTADNSQNYTYSFTQSFTSGSTSPIQMTVWTDNFFKSFTFNGATVTVSPLAPSPGDFAQPTPRVFTLNPTAGSNTLELTTYGDGTTDGVNVQFSSVPEPSSMALLGTGLFGLVPMIRRRRKS
jgi:hypothetical protein